MKEQFELDSELNKLESLNKKIAKTARLLFKGAKHRTPNEVYWGRVLVADMLVSDLRSDRALDACERWLPKGSEQF